MNPEFKRVKDIFLAALEKEGAADREAYLSEACAGAPAMRRQVDALLHRHEQAGSFLQFPSPDSPPSSPLGGVPLGTGSGVRGTATINEPITERPGTIIGPYKLMEQIGEGGMGLVFVAEQQPPVRRRVALKVIKPGMDTRTVIARFEAERQALALMDHPNIAQVHDGGVTPSGRPYFVMELVKGVPITQFCDDYRLNTRERLELFVDVCHAVQHAHHKGIIHRDIKPSNVIVVSHDGKPVVKVIDFGVAKSIGQQLTDKTVYTQFVQLVGTPLYMSPEQAGESGLDVDTRSDIYSLGVLLYELLTGTTPFNRERLKEASYEEIRRILREEDPPKPSTRISTLGQAATTVSTKRKSDPTNLRQLIRGELDWIVMKCLEKDRNRRYETANALAMDVQRYLHDEPVLACPPSAGYRFRKFARKYRTALRIAAAVVSLLVLGAAVSIWQAVRATRERDRAEASTRLAHDAVDRLFTRVSESAKLRAHGMEKFRKELLLNVKEFYERFIQEQFDAPGVRHDLGQAHLRLAEIHRQLGEYPAAEESLNQAVAILGELAREQPEAAQYQRDLAASYDALGLVYYNTARMNKAGEAYQQSLAIREQQAAANPEAAEYHYALAKTCSALGLTYQESDHTEGALAMSRKAQDILSHLLQAHPGISEYESLLAATQINLGQVYLVRGRIEEGEIALTEAQNIYGKLVKRREDVLPEDWASLAKSQAILGTAFKDRLEFDKAETLQLEALRIFQKLAQEHEDVQDYVYDVGRCYLELARTADCGGHPDEALDRYDQAIKNMKKAQDGGYRRAKSKILNVRIKRAGVLADRNHAKAIDETKALARQTDLQPSDLYDIGCTFSRASAAAEQDTKLSSAECSRLKALYAGQAMEFLKQAVAKGWQKPRVMKNDRDLNPLKTLPEFQKLLAELEAKTKE